MSNSLIAEAIRVIRPSAKFEIIGGVIDWMGGEPISEEIINAEVERLKQAKEERVSNSELKLDGVEFEGVMCSATGEDHMGMLAVKNYVKTQDKPTIFLFANGNSLKVTPENIDAFEAVWADFRASFFDE